MGRTAPLFAEPAPFVPTRFNWWYPPSAFRYLSARSVLAMSRVGTPLYMSPETLKGQGHDMGSDIWSLGCVLYELAQLESPFAGKHLTMKTVSPFKS